jgi:hypothetical protein
MGLFESISPPCRRYLLNGWNQIKDGLETQSLAGFQQLITWNSLSVAEVGVK